MKITKPSDLEMQILSVLFENGPSTARQVLNSMPDKKARAYTTILSAMQVMEKKSLLKHTTKGLSHVFSPAIERDQVIKPFIRKVVDEVFFGRPTALVQALLGDETVSPQELDQIRELLNNAEKCNTSTDQEPEIK